MHLKNATRIALFALGFLSIGTQVYLAREFMMVFSDHELMIGLVLAIWMLITGAGAFLGRFSSFLKGRNGLLLFLMMVAGVLPTLMVAGLDLVKFAMVPCGSMADLWQMIRACLFVQLPFCLLNGFLFSFLSLFSPDVSPGESYSWESLGSLASGVLVNFLFLWLLGPFHGLLVLTGFYLGLVVVFARAVAPVRQVLWVVAVSLVLVILAGVADFRAWTEKMLYPMQEVIYDTETPYGQVVVTKNEKQFNFFENGMLLFSSGNEISNEENVHYAMVQRANPSDVLLISGGYSGTLDEILKYRPGRVDYVELNPALIGIASRFTRQLIHSSVRVHAMDARRFLRLTTNRYDVVLVNLPPPSTLQLNRYYSYEFMREVRKKMKPGAIMAYSLPTSGEYVSEQAVNLNTVLWGTLKQCFGSVLIIPAGRNYFLASDSALSLDIPGLIQNRGIETTYVNKYYLDEIQLKERSAYVTGSMALPGSVNRDFTPVAVWFQISWWLSHDKFSPALVMFIFSIILVLLLITLDPLNAGLFAGGFTVASLEIMLIFGFQVLCGYLFQTIGAIIMIFMLGLAAGAGINFSGQRFKTLNFYRWLQLSLALSALVIPLILQWMGNAAAGEWVVGPVIAVMAFFAAFIAGMEYRLAALVSDKTLKKTVTRNYSAELFGSAAGAFSVTLFLIPSVGMVYTGIFLAALNTAAAGSLFLVRRRG